MRCKNTAAFGICLTAFLAVSLNAQLATATELLSDPGFEHVNEIEHPDDVGVDPELASPWDWVLVEDPMPTLNATTDPLSGAEHAEMILDTSLLPTVFGPGIRSSAFAGEGASAGVTDFIGLDLTLTMNYKVTVFNMVSPNPIDEPAGVFLRMYVDYFSDIHGFLGFGGFSEVLADVFIEGANANYVNYTYDLVVPDFGTPVTSVGYTLAVVQPETELLGPMTGNATIIIDDVSLDADVPIPGDFNMDLKVDGADFLLLQQGLGTIYDATDLANWESNYGMGVGPVSSFAAVPEPASVALMLVAGALFAASRRRLGR